MKISDVIAISLTPLILILQGGYPASEAFHQRGKATEKRGHAI